eukprot:1161053-Pelagomonas_calceolata.AAC.12
MRSIFVKASSRNSCQGVRWAGAFSDNDRRDAMGDGRTWDTTRFTSAFSVCGWAETCDMAGDKMWQSSVCQMDKDNICKWEQDYAH